MPEDQNLRQETFITPERFVREQVHEEGSLRGRLLIASCCSGSYLAKAMVARYKEHLDWTGGGSEVLSLEDVDFRFSDTESCARLDMHVSGHDVFLFQALLDPTVQQGVDANYMAFLISARAFREHGANHVTAVLPYLAYGRQDKPTKFMREPTTAKLMADLSLAAGVDRLLTWHAHADQLQGFYGNTSVTILNALTLFIEEFQRFRARKDVIVVAPDAGASRFVTYFSRALNLKSAIASKHRPRPEAATITEVIGDFSGKRVAIVLDDMISSGGTIYETVKRLAMDYGIREVYVGASHNLCLDIAYERLSSLHADYHLRQVVVTNSIPQTSAFQTLPFLSVKCLSDTLSRVINRIHYNRSVSQLFYQGQGRRKLVSAV
ncbi:MAG: ribose-phosphate pyrophosphokinase [Anaerolineae bacterium]|nr:ribose-phosphate pyrophosphokinase [Anaerolineae bacterium]